MRRVELSFRGDKVESKNALPTFGYLKIAFTFKILEAKRLGLKEEQVYTTEGSSRVYDNVRKNKNEMKTKAIYNGVKFKFPNGTVTPYDVKIVDYAYVYYLNNYREEEKNKKQYQVFTDTDTHKTKYYVKDKDKFKQEEYEIYEVFINHIDYP